MRLPLIALLAAVAVLQALPAATAPAAPQVIKLDRYRQALWTVRVTVKGSTGDFLLDTGGGLTLLSEAFAKRIDCRFWGRTTGYNMFGKRSDWPHCDGVQLRAGDVALTPADVGTIDFGDQFPGDKAPDGLLSLDVFAGKVITIDQTARTLTIETPASLAARTAGAREVPLRLSWECSARCLSAFIGVPTAAGRTWLILDSGAGGVSLISKDHAELFALKPDAGVQRLAHQIAPGIAVDSPAMVTDMIMDGNLGQPFLSRHVVTLDLANSRAWLRRTG
jgi:hypothetical protein